MKISKSSYLAIKTFFLLSIMFIFYSKAFSQQLLNLNFEKTSIEHPVRPWGWEVESGTSTTLNMDSVIRVEGKYSLKINNNTQDASEKIVFGIEPFEFRNKTINLRGKIKTKDLNGSAYVSLNTSTEDDKAKISQQFSNTTDWQNISLDFFVPDTTTSISFGLHYQGSGNVWFDDFRLSSNNKEYTEVQIAEPFSKKQLNWIKKASSPLLAVDALPNHSFEDLAPLKKMIGNARIIALGEATHGTSEFFRLKHRVLAFAVKELGVRIFGIEGNMLTVENINQYVLSGQGTAKGSMRGIFMVWYNTEVLNMIEWVRDYNQQHPENLVQFVGYDMQDLYTPLDSLFSFLEKKSPSLLKSTSVLLTDLKKNGSNQFTVSESVKLEWYKNASKAFESIQSQEKQWLKEVKTKVDSSKVYWGIQYANLVKQFAENAHKGFLSFYRDEAMAENISWFLSHEKPDTRMLIWAHDYHISRGDHPDNDLNIYWGRSMGRHLSQKYGDDYKAYAISTYEGDYRGMINYQNFKQVKCPLHKSPQGTLDEALHHLALKNKSAGMILDLSKAKSQKWLTKALRMRFANHVNIEYGYWTRYSIPYQFDGILFVDQTTSAKTLK